MGRAFSPLARRGSDVPWGCAPGWYGAGPLALQSDQSLEPQRSGPLALAIKASSLIDQGWVVQQLGLGWVVVEELLLDEGGLVAVEPLAVWLGLGGWGLGQGDGAPPPMASGLRRSLSRGGRMLMERSQAVARRGQFSSGALGGCMPKPWPPVA